MEVKRRCGGPQKLQQSTAEKKAKIKWNEKESNIQRRPLNVLQESWTVSKNCYNKACLREFKLC